MLEANLIRAYDQKREQKDNYKIIQRNAHIKSLLYQPYNSEDFQEKGTYRTSLFDQHHPQMQIPNAPHHLFDLKKPKFM